MRRFINAPSVQTLALWLTLIVGGCSHASLGKDNKSSNKRGRANVSWYNCCARTADGKKFYPLRLSAAHRSLPFGSWILFTNPDNHRTARAVINDRGPFIKGRLFDLSEGAAIALGFKNQGTAVLEWELVK